MAGCTHRKVTTYVFLDGNAPAGLWACADCGHKFAPVHFPMERDAERYRWLRGDDPTGRINEFWKRACIDESLTMEQLDRAIDAEMARRVNA